MRAAALETLAENLSDGVIAPLFWFLLLGVPGAMAYKMVNTLDSMIGYHSERYLLFGGLPRASTMPPITFPPASPLF